MPKQTINTSTPNSGKGDSLFSAFTKINANFTELYDEIANIDVPEIDLTDYALTTDIPDVSNFITAQDIPAIPTDVSDLTDTQSLLGQGGEIDLSITVSGTAYKGFGARYGRVYNNSNSSELTLSKIVIFKDTAVTNSTIDNRGGESDDFAVTGLGPSDVVALFVLYGDTNSEKSLDILREFARVAIDTVILEGGVEGSANTITAMRSAFYDNIATLTAVAGGLVENFQFFVFNTDFNVSFNTAGQGTGSGFNVSQLSYNLNTDQISVTGWSNGPGYSVNDVIVIPGTSITYQGTPLLSPDNDVTITITSVGVTGFIQNFTVAGTLPRPQPQWPENNINDGGADQYDNANYINTNLAQEISYAGGEIVADATASFGAGSSYVALYSSSIFGFIATGSSATQISTSGNSGADGNSTTDTGELLTVDQTYNPALTNLTLTNDPLRSSPILFVKEDYATVNNVDVIEDDSTLQIGITRGENGGIYNPFTEGGWDSSVSPQGTLWSVGNTDDLSDIARRNYTNFYAAYGSGGLGNKVPGSTAIMFVPSIEKYYLIEWISWTQGGQGGGFSYRRTEIDITQIEQGIQFADGTRITTAEGLGRVKSTAPGSRRIEEVSGYKEVSITERITTDYISTSARTTSSGFEIYVSRTSELDTIFQAIFNGGVNANIELSFDNITFRPVWLSSIQATEYWLYYDDSGPIPEPQTEGNPVYIKITSGGDAVVWWNNNELPSGGENFRGAVIDYHAYDTNNGTIIGTIHIVKDSDYRNITHTEVLSGSSGLEQLDLWIVPEEGRIAVKNNNGSATTIKIQWIAKLFYGIEYYD